MKMLISLAAVLIITTASALADHPDVVLLMTDQHRYDELSVLGTPGAQTPAMDQICNSGAMFTHAFVPTPQCSATRAAIMTGRFPHHAGVPGNVSRRRDLPAGQSGPLNPSIPSLGSVFSKAGYQTAYFGKWHLGDSPAEHGFQHVAVASGREIALHVADFLRTRDEQPQKPPLLLVISWINPHDIYRINRPDLQVPDDIEARLPPSVDDDLSKKPFPQRHFLAEDQGKPFVDYTHDQWRRYVRYYHQLTTKVDADIGRVTELVRKHSPDALTVFTSEHGDLGGAHGLPYKCPAMYEELIRVPLAISWPNKIKAAKNDALISSIDLLPTLCDLAGVKPPAGIDGRSLRPLIEGQSPEEAGWRDTIFGEYYGKQAWRVPIRMVRTRRWKYTRYTRYGEELYDLEVDPHEMNNLAQQPHAQDEKKQLAAKLATWMKTTNDPFPRQTLTDRRGKETD